MQLESISLTRRKPVEQYGYEEVYISAALSKEDKAEEAVLELRQLVDNALKTPLTVPVYTAPTAAPEAEAPAKEVVKAKKASKAKAKEEAPVETEEEKQLEFKEEEKVETSEAPANSRPVTGKSTKDKSLKSSTPYDRSNENHKRLIGEMLDREFPGWRKNSKLIKEVSADIEGEPFLDKDGDVLEAFTVEFKARHTALVEAN